MCKYRNSIRKAALAAPCTRFITACLEFPPQDVRYMQEHEPEIFDLMVAWVNYLHEFDYHGDAATVIRHDNMASAIEALQKPFAVDFMAKLIYREGLLTGIYTVTW